MAFFTSQKELCTEVFAFIKEFTCSVDLIDLFLVAVKPNTCASTGSEVWRAHFNGKTITLQPGSPCNEFKGYCDVFMRCRLVDADGPLARLKKAIFNPELYENIAEWIVVRMQDMNTIFVSLFGAHFIFRFYLVYTWLTNDI